MACLANALVLLVLKISCYIDHSINQIKMATRYKHRLAVIMFADIVGYSALMEHDEQMAYSLRLKFKDVFRKAINFHEGQTIEFYGDGALAIFDSAGAAVKAAIDIQRQLNTEPEVPVRIGLHQGEIGVDEEGIYGTAVNTTARVESIAEPRTILMTDKVYHEIQNFPDANLISLGSFKLKNIQRAVELFGVQAEGLPKPRVAHLHNLKARLSKSRNIVVLPFVNMSTDEETEYFTDGVTEEIINVLSRVEGIHVISRTSAFAYKNTDKDIKQIAEELDTEKVLEGSVRKSGERIRISVQFINCKDGYQIWSDSFDHTLEDIFDTQEEIARKIATKMKQEFSGGMEAKAVFTSSTHDLDAYKLYLYGLFCYNQLVPSEMIKGIPYVEKAIEKDPRYVDAYVLLSDLYINLAIGGFVNHHEAYLKAEEYLEKALELNENNPDAAANKATIDIFYRWKFDEAYVRLKKALRQFPSQPKLHLVSSARLLALGHVHQSELVIERALALDPLNLMYHRLLSDIHYINRDLSSARKQFARMQEISPGNSLAVEFNAWATLILGDPEEALGLFEQLDDQQNFTTMPDNRIACAKAVLGDMEPARKFFESREEEYSTKKSGSLAINLAICCRFMKDIDNCIKYLQEAVHHRMSTMIFLKPSPLWDPVKGHPEFEKLCEQIYPTAELKTSVATDKTINHEKDPAS